MVSHQRRTQTVVIIMVSSVGMYSTLRFYLDIAKTFNEYGYMSMHRTFFKMHIGYIGIYRDWNRKKNKLKVASIVHQSSSFFSSAKPLPNNSFFRATILSFTICSISSALCICQAIQRKWKLRCVWPVHIWRACREILGNWGWSRKSFEMK